MSQPPFGPPPGDQGRPDGPPLPPPVPPGPMNDPGTGSTPPPPQWQQPQWHQPPQGGQQQPPAQQPQWQQLPPEQLARMHQPGVVPLRPLTLGDIFGGALQTMRRNPEATIGMGFIVLAVLLVPSLLLTLLLGNLLTGLSDLDLQGVTLTLGGLLSALSSIALTGMIVHVVGEAVLGDRASLAGTWRAVRSRLLALVGTVLLIGLLTVVALVALVLLLVLVVTVLGDGGLSILLVVLLTLAALVGFVWAACRLSLAPAPVVLERVGPWRGITRAWTLTKGAQSWRIVGITILAGIVTTILAAVIQVPVTAGLASALGPAGLDPLSPAVVLTDHALQLVVGALTIPFTAGVTALLYLDQRIRREGLDVSLVRSAQARAAQRSD
ncbi:membrane protein [Serinicoccus hydrothermalis]|uniref:Membrane protein n=1 Tax=Serinicoccus hydrothermalis TaxID=1758689 RepID=A0A1B1NGF2_9MICO|nr:hypothetical protein [Serinicoccus hydrothermalis]ANS80506.1 membrane protein [Serinicoccus hydrothermalis]